MQPVDNESFFLILQVVGHTTYIVPRTSQLILIISQKNCYLIIGLINDNVVYIDLPGSAYYSKTAIAD